MDIPARRYITGPPVYINSKISVNQIKATGIWDKLYTVILAYTHILDQSLDMKKEVLGTQKSLAAGGNWQAFDARYLLDF